MVAETPYKVYWNDRKGYITKPRLVIYPFQKGRTKLNSRKSGIKKNYIFIFLCIAGIFVWWYIPVHFLSSIDPMEIKEIRVYSGNSGNQFVMNEPEDIAFIVNSIKEISFRKYEIISETESWYYLSFIGENGEETASIGIRNYRYVIKALSQKNAIFYKCNGELEGVGNFLDSTEAALFPDYNRDPDFVGFKSMN